MCLQCDPPPLWGQGLGPSFRKPHSFPVPHRGPPGWLMGPSLLAAKVRVLLSIPAAPSRALRMMVAGVRSGCPQVELCSPVQSLRRPGPNSRTLRPRQPWAGQPTCLPRRLAEFTAHRPGSKGARSCGRGLLLLLMARGLEPGSSPSHPVPQDPALAAQLWSLVCRGPGPGISHVWLVSCRGDREVSADGCLPPPMPRRPLPPPSTHLSTHMQFPTHSLLHSASHHPLTRLSVSATPPSPTLPTNTHCHPLPNPPIYPPSHSHTIPTMTLPEP